MISSKSSSSNNSSNKNLDIPYSIQIRKTLKQLTLKILSHRQSIMNLMTQIISWLRFSYLELLTIHKIIHTTSQEQQPLVLYLCQDPNNNKMTRVISNMQWWSTINLMELKGAPSMLKDNQRRDRLEGSAMQIKTHSANPAVIFSEVKQILCNICSQYS